MTIQNASDANKSTPEYERKRDAAPPAPGKSDKHESHEQGKSRDAGPNEGKGAFSKGEHSTGPR